jgi:hypothetical protein
MTHDALHYTAFHNTEPWTILNLTGTTLRNLGTSFAQSWHLVGTILNLVEHNTAQYWTLLATYSNLYTLLFTIAGSTTPSHRTQITRVAPRLICVTHNTVEVGVTSANEGAGVGRSGRDLVKNLRLLPICQQCLFEWDAQDAHLVGIQVSLYFICIYVHVLFLLLGHCPAFRKDRPGKAPVWPRRSGAGACLREQAKWWMSGVFLELLCSYCSFKWWCWTVLQGF